MGHRCRFVQPEIVRLYLADQDGEADYIDVKKELTAGEQRHIFSGIIKEMNLGEKTTLDPDQVGKTKLVEYLVGWSFLGTDGQPEPVSESAIDCLDPDTYKELIDLVDAHEASVIEARRQKKAPSATASSVISESPAP